MKFSIVTPNYNMGQYLPDTIESVLNNIEQGDEYFIIDGGSNDCSIQVIRSYESDLSGWISEQDNGYPHALEKGFTKCKGELLCWINSGDLLLEGALEEAKREIVERGADLIFGDDLFIDEDGKVLSLSRGKVRSLRKIMLYGGWTPLQDACFWRRSLYEACGGIDSRLKFAADYDFFLRASILGNCVYTPTVFSAFRKHENQTSIVLNAEYEVERKECRERAIGNMGIEGYKRISNETYYWFLVRWRHFILRHLWRQPIFIGEPAHTISACSTTNYL
jgi:glycosyltransferase involved in cell wall biosynthesis